MTPTLTSPAIDPLAHMATLVFGDLLRAGAKDYTYQEGRQALAVIAVAAARAILDEIARTEPS